MSWNIVLVVGLLKGIQYWVQAYPRFEGIVQCLFKVVKKFLFVIVVKCINYFIGEPYKSVDVVNILSDRLAEHPCRHCKGGAVRLRHHLTAILGYFVKY